MNSAMNDTTNVGTEECAVCTPMHYAAEYLREIADGRAPEDYWYGLCYNLSCAIIDASYQVSLEGYNIIQKYAPLWPEYSGNPEYPVPYQGVDAQCAYHEVGLWVGEYGAARRRLAGFIADCLEKELV